MSQVVFRDAPARRAAIVAGCRTPFAKAGTLYRDLSALDPALVDLVVMGQVIPSVQALREIQERLVFPRTGKSFHAPMP